jgi:hypothetical protein
VLALHRGARASLSDPAFSSDGSGGGKKISRRPQAPPNAWEERDLDPKKEGERRIRPQMTTMRHLPVCAQDQDQLLVNGDTNERNGRLRGRRQARECAQPEPMLSSTGIDSQIHTPPSTGGEQKRMGERKRNVWRRRNSCLRLRRRRVGCVYAADAGGTHK